MILADARLLLPRRLFLAVGDTVELPAVFVEDGKKKRVEVECDRIEGEAVKVLKNKVVGLKEGRALIGCRYKDLKRMAIVRVVSKGEAFSLSQKVITLRVGEKAALPKVEVPKGYDVKWLVRPKWLARIVGDSIEGLSEGKGIVQLHIVKGNEVVREFPIRLIVSKGEADLRIQPHFVRLKPGDAVKFKLIGEYKGDVEWYVLNDRVGRIGEDGTFVALKPGRTVVVARVKGKSTISVKALVIVNSSRERSPRRR